MFRLCFDPDSLYIIDCKYCSCLQSYTSKVYCLYCLGLSFKGTNLNMLNSLLINLQQFSFPYRSISLLCLLNKTMYHLDAIYHSALPLITNFSYPKWQSHSLTCHGPNLPVLFRLPGKSRTTGRDSVSRHPAHPSDLIEAAVKSN